MHTPVLLQEVVSSLDLREGLLVIDATIGSGGHAREILKRIGTAGTLLGIDWDCRGLEALRGEIGNERGAVLVCGNYADLPDIIRNQGFRKADRCLLDLGFSSAQIEPSGRGFSFMNDELLRMTYNENEKPLHEALKTMKEEEMVRVLRVYGEERFASRIARAIYSRERRDPIMTTRALREVVLSAIPTMFQRRSGIHPATRTFQAFRIYINKELENLRTFLEGIPEILAPGGIVAIVSFHSLEDRIVKHSFRELARAGVLAVVTKKPITPTEKEIEENPRSRSAKLRVGQLKS